MEKRITFETVLNPQTLCVEMLKITALYEVTLNVSKKHSRRCIERNVEIIKKFPLSHVDISELRIIRKSEQPGIIYKNGIRFYYGEIQKNLNISGRLLGNHKCSHQNVDCDKLYAIPEDDGGCLKVLEKNHKIENFYWITQGFQTLNCYDQQFFIANCEHFQHTGKRRKNVSLKDLIQIRKNLADLYYN